MLLALLALLHQAGMHCWQEACNMNAISRAAVQRQCHSPADQMMPPAPPWSALSSWWILRPGIPISSAYCTARKQASFQLRCTEVGYCI